MVTRKVKLFLTIVAATLQTACNIKKDSEAKDNIIDIVVSYPADYFVVVPEAKITSEEIKQCNNPNNITVSREKLEQIAQEKAKEIARVQKAKELKIEKQKRDDYHEYLIARSNLIRSIRRKAGASVLSSNEELSKKKKSKEENVEYRMSDTKYHSPNVMSGFPVDRSFILTEDRTIPAVLLDSINSQIAGSVRAMVAEDVFGADGRYKLLEKGDVILGRYNETKKVGETRLEVLFHRIIRAADGAEIYSNNEPFAYAADKMGRTGLVGEVDNRNWERYGLAFSTALVGGFAGLAKSKSEDSKYDEFVERISDNTTEITNKILEEYLDIAPIITVAQGEPFIVRLAADITLKAPVDKK